MPKDQNQKDSFFGLLAAHQLPVAPALIGNSHTSVHDSILLVIGDGILQPSM